ncbi:hypothetical protein [Bartonella florencae]|uniref:hypothetical protein n=1 Tax=Bartonella florencae TaxID=928210 RepID=UPI00055B2C0B|nr:hypothetical protein [Bartonella florencae]
MLAVLFCMIIVGLHYFFIKRARLYFALFKTLKNNAAYPSHEGEAIEQNISFLSFKESLLLSTKECKRIFFFSLILALFYAAFSTLNLVGWKSDARAFITLLFHFISVCFLFFAPIIGLLCLKLTSKLKKMIQQLEEERLQQDKALSLQDVRGGTDDQ